VVAKRSGSEVAKPQIRSPFTLSKPPPRIQAIAGAVDRQAQFRLDGRLHLGIGVLDAKADAR